MIRIALLQLLLFLSGEIDTYYRRELHWLSRKA